MRIGIDARFYGILGKGLGRYTEQLIIHLEKVDTENVYFIFLRPENFDAYVPGNKNFKKVLVNIPWYSWREQLFFPWLLLRYHCDLIHFTHFNVPILYRRPFVLTIHDLILFHFPTIRSTTRSIMGYGVKYLMYRIILRSAISRAKRIIAVSRYTRDDISKNFHIKKENIAITYQAAVDLREKNDEKYKEKNISEMFKKYGILNKYFLYVGNAYPHKNLERLVKAFQAVRGIDAQLILVGKKDYFYDRLERFVKQEKVQRVIFMGEVSDDDLGRLYRGAVAYVFPSLYEGFGLPPFEAMAQGTPVIASSVASLPEVLGPAALYFNPEKASDIARCMERIANDSSLRSRLAREGYRRIRKFSWESLAKDTKSVYELAL